MAALGLAPTNHYSLDRKELTWTYLDSFGFAWTNNDLLGPTGTHVLSLRFIGARLHPLGSTCSHLDSLAIWNSLGLHHGHIFNSGWLEAAKMIEHFCACGLKYLSVAVKLLTWRPETHCNLCLHRQGDQTSSPIRQTPGTRPIITLLLCVSKTMRKHNFCRESC